MSEMILEMLPLGDFQANVFLIPHETNHEQCWIVDCGPDPSPLLEAITRSGRTPAGIVLTHCHHDHIGGIEEVLAAHGPMPIAAHSREADWNQRPDLNLSAFLGTPTTCTAPTVLMEEGGECLLGSQWEILHVPGHSPGSVAFHHVSSNTLIAGDTLFSGSIGRIDFPTSDPNDMKVSLTRLMGLSDHTRVYSGHGPSTTIGAEKSGNPFILNGIPSF